MIRRLCVLVVLLASVACQNPKASLAGTWDLYVPADAGKPGEVKPEGHMTLSADGKCEMSIRAGKDTITFAGTYRTDGLTVTIEGSETRGEAEPAKVLERGTISDDWRTFRVYGKDFVRRSGQ